VLLAVGLNSGIYKLLLVLHILCAIVGIGGVTLNAFYGMAAQRRNGPDALAISETNYDVSMIAEKFIYAVFPLGILLVLTSDDAWSFSDLWIWLSMLVYIAALGVSHGLVLPTARKMNALMRDLTSRPAAPGGPPPEVAQLEALGKKIGMSSMLLHVATIALVALMVWKPMG
jgi:uncharacterized membrane protein